MPVFNFYLTDVCVIGAVRWGQRLKYYKYTWKRGVWPRWALIIEGVW
jgi:hypothetical protein